MAVSGKLTAELKAIIQDEYKVVLQDEKLSEITNGLIGFFGLLAEIDHHTRKEKGIHEEK